MTDCEDAGVQEKRPLPSQTAREGAVRSSSLFAFLVEFLQRISHRFVPNPAHPARFAVVAEPLVRRDQHAVTPLLERLRRGSGSAAAAAEAKSPFRK